jgi:cytochrome c biogenesis factor
VLYCVVVLCCASPARDETASYVAWGHSTVGNPWHVVCCAVLCCAVLCCVVVMCCAVRSRHETKRLTMWHGVTRLLSTLGCCVLCSAVLCCAVLCCAVLCCAVLCYAALCCAMQRCAVLCSAVRRQHETAASHAACGRTVAVFCCLMLCAVLCCAVICSRPAHLCARGRGEVVATTEHQPDLLICDIGER